MCGAGCSAAGPSRAPGSGLDARISTLLTYSSAPPVGLGTILLQAVVRRGSAQSRSCACRSSLEQSSPCPGRGRRFARHGRMAVGRSVTLGVDCRVPLGLVMGRRGIHVIASLGRQTPIISMTNYSLAHNGSCGNGRNRANGCMRRMGSTTPCTPLQRSLLEWVSCHDDTYCYC